MFSDRYGGVTTTFIRNEVEYFARHHRLKYVALGNDAPETPHDVEVVPIQRRPVWDRIVWQLWRADLLCDFHDAHFARRLRTAIEQFRPDVIHCQFGYEALRLLQNVDVAAGPPIIVHFHGYDASEMLRKRSYVRALSPFLNLPNVWPIVVSEYMRSDMERAGFSLSRAHLLRCGVDLELFHSPDDGAASPPREQIVLSQISSLIPKKGHRETLHAISRLLSRKPEYRGRLVFKIAGNGPDRDSLLDLAQSLGLASNVEFLGPITPVQAVALLATTNVFAHHSITDAFGHKEGIPNAIMEAMAMELPVAATRHAGIPELVDHGVHGLLCEERDVETYSCHLEQLISWGRRPENRRRVQQDYNKTSHNRKLEQIYREAIAARTLARP